MALSKKLRNNFAALAIGCIIAFLIAEAALRVYHPFEFRVKGDKIVLPANKKYTIENTRFTSLDKTIIHHKNSLGFRGEEPPKNFKEYITIITVGGSTTECFYLSDGKTWPDRLGEKLKERFRYIWINNAGLDGQSTYGHIILMEDYVRKIKPKVVLFLVGINEVGKTGPSELDNTTIKKRFSIYPRDAARWLANHSEVFSLVLNMYRYVLARKMGVAHDNIELIKNSDIITDPLKREEILNTHRDRYLKGFESRLERLIQISRKNDITPIFITQSALYGNAVDDVTDMDLKRIKFCNLDGELQWKILELYNDVTRRVALKENILMVDLAREMPKSTRFYYDVHHYNNPGANEVAGIIYKHLYPFLSERYTSFKKR